MGRSSYRFSKKSDEKAGLADTISIVFVLIIVILMGYFSQLYLTNFLEIYSRTTVINISETTAGNETTTPPPSSSPSQGCVQDCAYKDCGDDGCGGSCGECMLGYTCSSGQCACTPLTCQSLGNSCGSWSNGCRGILDCGACPAGKMCHDGQCVCAPNCAGKQCGSDGCGGSCGTCAEGLVCDASLQCSREVFHGIFVYGWFPEGVPASVQQLAVEKTGANYLVYGADISNGGMQASLANKPAGIKCILQPSPLTIVDSSHILLQGQELENAYKNLSDILEKYPECEGVIIVHEDGLVNPNFINYETRFIEFLRARNIEPIALLDSATCCGATAARKMIMQTYNISIWAETRPSLWDNYNINPPYGNWAWNATSWYGNMSKNVSVLVNRRIAELESKKYTAKFDAILMQLEGIANFNNTKASNREYGTWPWAEPNPDELISFLRYHNAYKDKTVVWAFYPSSPWRALKDNDNNSAVLKGWWAGNKEIPTPPPKRLPAYRGFMYYPYQHAHARNASGSTTEVEFATLSARIMKQDYGATAVMVVGSPQDNNSLGSYEDIVRAFVAADLKVILYIQGDYYFDGSRFNISNGQKVMNATWVQDRLPKLANYLARFDDIKANLIGVCISEEAGLLTHHWNGTAVIRNYPNAIDPDLQTYWAGIKNITDLPQMAIIEYWKPYTDALVAVPDASRPEVMLVETYANLYIDGKIMDRAKDMLTWTSSSLTNAQSDLAGKMAIGHMPMTAGVPLDKVNNKGWEFLLLLDPNDATKAHPWFRQQVEYGAALDGVDYQFGWAWASVGDDTARNYDPYYYDMIYDKNFHRSLVGEALVGVWK